MRIKPFHVSLLFIQLLAGIIAQLMTFQTSDVSEKLSIRFQHNKIALLCCSHSIRSAKILLRF